MCTYVNDFYLYLPHSARFIQEEQTLYVHEHEAYPMTGWVNGVSRGPMDVYNDSPMERGILFV